MTTASATPQQMRDRLLQAIDSQSNICNMVAVIEVITYLEKYPITKEALEETRLGKVINDVRKKTKDEDLAKRAKKLLRNWQKLIEPGQNEMPSRGVQSVAASANGGAYPCRTDLLPPTAPLAYPCRTDLLPPTGPLAGKPAPAGLRPRNDSHNTYSPKAEKSSNRKRRGEQRDGLHLPAKISKMASFEGRHNPALPSSNGIVGSPEPPLDPGASPAADKGRPEYVENDKHNKIPVNAVKPHPSSPGLTKLPSTSSLLKAAVLQQHARMDEGGGGQHQPRSPRCSSLSPRTMKPETMAKRSSTYAPKGTLSSPSQSSAQVPSPMPLSLPLTSPVQVSTVDGPGPDSSLHWHGSTSLPSLPPHSTATLEPPSVSPHTQLPLHSLDGPGSSSETVRTEGEATEGKRRKKYRSRDYTVNLQGQPTEDRTKPVRLKERRLTFDPVTGQIKPLVQKESCQGEEPLGLPPTPEPQRTELPQEKPPLSAPSPFQQTNWKELSRNEIIQSYLNRQSNVLTSSGAQSPGAHFFMTEYMKREEHDVRESKKTHVLLADGPVQEPPGLTRAVTSEELRRVQSEHWPGVNGCADTKGAWYDWTECISLDPHGDGSRLNILPYVWLD